MKKLVAFSLIQAVLALGLLAQQATNPVPANAPAPAIETPAAAPALTNAASGTNAPTAKAAKKKKKTVAETARKKAPGSELKTVPLVAGPAVVVASNVNVRGQAGLKGEVVTRLTKGDAVTVLEEVTLKKSAPDEPSAWARILLPTNTHVWVNSSFINASNKTVAPRKLNLRAGPGENYSVLGTLKRGDTVKDLNTKGDWTEIEPPADAFAFVAAQYLKQETPATVAANTPVEPAPTPTTVTEPAAVAPATTETPTTPPVAAATNETAQTTNTAASTTTTNAPAVEEPPPPRIVQREGVVRGTVSIQAPTPFELVSPDNGRAINYLYTTSPDLDLRRYKGIRIVVTGEESLDERWRNTPVITIQRIQVIE